MRSRILVAAAVLSLPTAALAQRDSLTTGSRVRVSIAAPRGNSSVFIGNLERLDTDSLIVAIPGGKGTIHLSRAAIFDVSVSDGRESRFYYLKREGPILLPPLVTLAVLPALRHTPHWAGIRNQQYVLVGAFTTRLLFRTPPERWRPDFSWMRQVRP